MKERRAKRAWLVLMWLGVVLLGVAGCAPKQDPLPEVDEATRKSVVTSNNAFALKLHKVLRKEQENLFFSPYSISSAMTMVNAGAKGDTAKEIRDLLALQAEGDALHKANAWLAIDLNNRGRLGQVQLSVANRLFGQKEYPFTQDFLTLLKDNYLAELVTVDFAGQTEAARKMINDWVAQQTNDKIKDILAPGSLDPQTRLVLANAIYFKGAWLTAFKKKDTSNQDFHISPNKTIQVPMMQSSKIEANYLREDDLEVLSLPYKGGEFSMVILLPKDSQGALTALENNLDTDKLKGWLNKTSTIEKLQVSIPKFKFTNKIDLIEKFKTMGVQLAFDPDKADFSGINNGNEPLFINKIVHKAFVEVNEEGTEAAAATIIGVGATSAPPSFRADRPFLFLIYDHKTGNILFLGRVYDPSQEGG